MHSAENSLLTILLSCLHYGWNLTSAMKQVVRKANAQGNRLADTKFDQKAAIME